MSSVALQYRCDEYLNLEYLKVLPWNIILRNGMFGNRESICFYTIKAHLPLLRVNEEKEKLFLRLLVLEVSILNERFLQFKFSSSLEE